MATIREELVLVDRFSSTFSQYLRMGQQMAELLERLRAGQGGYDETARRGAESLEDLAGSGRRTNEILEQMSDTLRELRERTDDASNGQERANRSFQQGASAAGGLAGRLQALASAYLGLRGTQKLITLSDTWIQTTARLERMNDGLHTTAELQEIIFQAAQRSRGVYQDTADLVSKLGTLAGEAFNSSEEVVAFAEQINKQFALSGTTVQGAQAAMLQLTQAMGSGVLRGEELNSILEQAPTITKSIAGYLGVSVGEMRKLASEGQITAEVVKAAMFHAAGETNKAFDAVPLTFGQAWNRIKNEALAAIRPSLEQLNALLNSDMGQQAISGLVAAVHLLGEGLVWLIHLAEAGSVLVMEHGDLVIAVLAGIGAAAALSGAEMVKSAAVSAISWAAANWPLLLIAGSVALIIFLARQMGATWEDICGVVGGVFGEMYAFAMNVFLVPVQNGFAAFANFLGNAFHMPLKAIKVLFLDMAEYVLRHISNIAHSAEDLINRIPGMSVNLTRGIDNIYDMVKGASQDVKDASGWKEYVKAWDFVNYSDAWTQGTNRGRSFGRAIDKFSMNDLLSDVMPDYAGFSGLGMPSALQDISADTAAIRNAVALSEEDLKMLVDMAEREYVNNINLTAQTPVINVTGQNTGDSELDNQRLAEAIRDILLEQAASHTDLSYT